MVLSLRQGVQVFTSGQLVLYPQDPRRVGLRAWACAYRGGSGGGQQERIPFDWTAVFGTKQRQIMALCLGKYCGNDTCVLYHVALTYLIESEK
jgi:hypothetical protein